MLLNEVALGRMCELLDDKYMEKPQPGTDSTKALGATAPDPKQDIFWYSLSLTHDTPELDTPGSTIHSYSSHWPTTQGWSEDPAGCAQAHGHPVVVLPQRIRTPCPPHLHTFS
jgi:hypothetical protein